MAKTEPRYYAGVGNRDTPSDMLMLCTYIAKWLSQRKYTLRTGGADGADSAFLNGAASCQVFVPWPGYNNFRLKYEIPEEAFEIAGSIHPAWKTMNQGVRRLHARNMMQVLGPDVHSPSDFVICYTRDGAQEARECSTMTGGTATAIICASERDIPVINIRRPEWPELLSVLTGDDAFEIAYQSP